jgi:hypothetical protein
VGDAERLFVATARTQRPKEIWKEARELNLPVGELLEWVARQVKNAGHAGEAVNEPGP